MKNPTPLCPLGYHCYRGLLSPSTSVFLAAAGENGAEADCAALSRLSLGPAAAAMASGRPPALHLYNLRSRVGRPPPKDIVNIVTSDEELFPVKKKLLRPCIALTKAVRDRQVPSV